MTILMGENMMRKDGADHSRNARSCFPRSARAPCGTLDAAVSQTAGRILTRAETKGQMRSGARFRDAGSAEALKLVTGLTNMAASRARPGQPGHDRRLRQLHGRSRRSRPIAMIAPPRSTPYRPIMMPVARADTSRSARDAGARRRCPRPAPNIKLIISGGQNEPRDAIAGAAWALLDTPTTGADPQGARHGAQASRNTRAGSRPSACRRAAWRARDTVCGVTFDPGTRVFFMFSSAGPRRGHFDAPDASTSRATPARHPASARGRISAAAPRSRAR